MKMTMLKLAILTAVLTIPSMAMASTTYTGTLKTSDFTVRGQHKQLWKGKRGLIVHWAVVDHGGSYTYTYTAAAKGNKRLKTHVRKVLVNTTPVSAHLAPASTIGGLTSFKTLGKKVTVTFNADTLPGNGWLKIKGHGVRAFANVDHNIIPLIDDQIIDGPHDIPTYETDVTNGAVVPVPASAWMGLAMLGGLGAIRALRRKRTGI